MKIAIMAAWNTSSGVAMHAEPIGKALKKMGHKLAVFTYHKNDYHGDGITAKDESYVIRCFGTRPGTYALDSGPLVSKDYDILLVEDVGMLPVEKLANLMPVIKKKAKVVHVVHENKLCDHSWFYKIDWDSVVYFDERQKFLRDIYPNALYIPFPCYPSRRGDKKKAREKLGLPLDKKIIYSFGQRGYHAYYRDLPPKLKRNSVLLHVVSPDYQMLEELHPTEWRIIRKEPVIGTKRFDDYLFASDAAIFHKFQSRFYAVVSTTVYQALGCGCPIFVPRQSDFFHSVKKEVVHYSDITALNKRLVELLDSKKKRDQLIQRAEKFVHVYSPENIAKQFVELFERLLSR